MFAGHAAIATFVKGIRPRIPLVLLVPIAFAPDWIEWIGDGFGYHDRMLSHSLVSVGIGATVVAVVYLAVTRSGLDALAVWGTYVSHWAADFITGHKPTWPGGPEVGLMLYAHPVWDVIVESVVVLLCWSVYLRSIPAESRTRAIVWLAPVGLIGMQIIFAAMQAPTLL